MFLSKRKKGVTFIELIIVVVIVNILIVSAKPSYISYIEKKHADNVKLQMFQMVTDMERIKGRYYSYEAVLNSDNKLISNPDLMRYPVKTSETKRFDITITDLSSKTFKITATPTDEQGDFGVLSLEQSSGILKGTHVNENGLLIEEWY